MKYENIKHLVDTFIRDKYSYTNPFYMDIEYQRIFICLSEGNRSDITNYLVEKVKDTGWSFTLVIDKNLRKLL